MSQISAVPVSGTTPISVPTVSARQLAPWAVFVGLIALLALYFISAEQGATALLAGTDVHEWVHDGRHLLGFPCH